jgi:hypothetical protein
LRKKSCPVKSFSHYITIAIITNFITKQKNTTIKVESKSKI